MKQKKTIGGSIGLLIGVVIAILALVRGTWLVPLLIGTFAVWGLWLLVTQVFPRETARKPQQAEPFNRQLAQTLLHHVNYRVPGLLSTLSRGVLMLPGNNYVNRRKVRIWKA